MTEETSRQINNGPGDYNDLMQIFFNVKVGDGLQNTCSLHKKMS